ARTLTTVANISSDSRFVASDGVDLWVTQAFGGGTVTRISGANGQVLGTWTGAPGAFSILVAMGKIFVTGSVNLTESLFMIDPHQPPGAATLVATYPVGGSQLAFDGARIWDAGDNAITIITPGQTLPWSTRTVNTFVGLSGIVFDGA